MRVLLTTNEYPPYVYGGAGVHVEYLSRELAKLTPVEVRSFHDQTVDEGQLHVRGIKMDTIPFCRLPAIVCLAAQGAQHLSCIRWPRHWRSGRGG